MIRENLIVEFYDGKERQIRVVLPKDYKTSGKKYPVLYMLDGQNLFDLEDSLSGSTWEVREALEQLLEENKLDPMIIVGIDHAEEMRLTEYSPWDLDIDNNHVEGEGTIFSDFLINKLIPELETIYPLRSDQAGRTLAGSSMGALITVYIALKYPDHFSNYGIFSLCSWVNKPAFNDQFEQARSLSPAKYFIQVGGREGYNSTTQIEDSAASAAYLKDTKELVDQLYSLGVPPKDITLQIGRDDWHSEVAWRKYMPDFLLWIQNRRKKVTPSVQSVYQEKFTF